MKKGQVTLFVILAVVIVGVIIGLFFLLSSGNDAEHFSNSAVKNQVDNLKIHTQDCVASTTKEVLIKVALQGGYYVAPARSFSYAPVFFPYYYYEGDIEFPEIVDIERNLGLAVDELFYECMKNHNIVTLEVEFSRPMTVATVTSGNAHFVIDMPISVSDSTATTSIEGSDFDLNYNSSLYAMHEIASFITESHIEDPAYYCTSCVAEMAHERNLEVYMFPGIADELITGTVIVDTTTGVAQQYSYIFFNKYTGEEV
ncbi:MAG: hypothetical protein ACI83O_000803 [Patescibacteria group bacterium]|jgi:hypothetical protein